MKVRVMCDKFQGRVDFMSFSFKFWAYQFWVKDNYLWCLGGTMSGLIICGVEFRPIQNKEYFCMDTRFIFQLQYA